MIKLFKKLWFGSGVITNSIAAKIARCIGCDDYADQMDFIVSWQRKLANNEVSLVGMYEEILGEKLTIQMIYDDIVGKD
jgi:hypothetical protein